MFMFGAESAIRPDSLQRAGALGLLQQLLVRFRNDVATLDADFLTSDNLILSHGVRSVCSRESVLCTFWEVYSVYTSVGFSELRLNGRENGTKKSI